MITMESMENVSIVEKISIKVTRWVGSIQSLIVHTILFWGAFSFLLFWVNLDQILLVLTTLLSFEAIYLSIFIQMSVNRQERALHEVGKDVEEVQEDISGIEEDIIEIQEDVGEMNDEIEIISESIDDIKEDNEDDEDDEEFEKVKEK